MNYTREQVIKSIHCCALLPPPGDEVVRQYAEDWLELYDAKDKEQANGKEAKEE